MISFARAAVYGPGRARTPRRAVVRRLVAALLSGQLALVFVGFVTGCVAAADGAPERSHKAGLAGQLLVAAQDLRDPNFSQTVIYMIEHNPDGAMGLVVNVPLGKVPLNDLLGRLGLEEDDAEGTLDVHYGGPVDQGRAFFLHSTDFMLEGSVQVDDDFALTARPDMLRALAHGDGPKRSLFALGYAGWGPGQLESELARKSWIVIPAEASLVFAEEPAKIWQRAVALWGIDL